MKSVNKVIEKLRKPPALHNWVRHIRPRRDDTAFALHNFAINPPRTSLLAAVSICVQIVIDRISLTQAQTCVDAIRDPAARERAKWIVRAFHKFAMKNKLTGLQIFRDMIEFYPVAAGVRVPVKPTFVLNDDGRLTPYFLICWSSMTLTTHQKSLISSLIDRTILTLEEFEGSNAVVVCTPLAPYSKKERHVVSWTVEDYPPLSDDELRAVFDRYAGALNDAEKMIIESLS